MCLRAKSGRHVPHRYKPYRCLHLRASNRVLGSKVTNKHLATAGSHTDFWCVHTTLRESMDQFKLVEMFFSPPSGSYYIDQWLWVVFKMFFLSGHWEAFCPMDILLPLSQPSPLRNAGCWKLTTWSHQILWNLELNLHGECLWHVLRALEVHDFKINWKLLAPARCKQFQASAWL